MLFVIFLENKLQGKSLCSTVQYRHNHRSPSYRVHISKKVTILSNIFDPRFVEYTNAEPTDKKGILFTTLNIALNTL